MTANAKLIVVILLAALASLQSGFSDNHFDKVEIVQLLIAAAMAARVWFAQNSPSNVAAKAGVATTVAVLSLLATYVGTAGFEHLTTSQIVNLVAAAVTTIGVYLVPNSVVTAASRHTV